jgi:hypothetical protein
MDQRYAVSSNIRGGFDAVPGIDPKAADSVFRVHRILAVLYGLIGVIAVVAIGLAAFEGSARRGESMAGALLGTLAVGLMVLIPATLHGTLAYGVKKRATWAKGGSRAIAVLMLLGFPIGTLIGIYLLVQSGKPWPLRSAA